MNTRFEYLYRDGSNYKQWGAIVLQGVLPQTVLLQRLERALEGGEFFIASQIDVPEVFHDTWPMYADDHCWHEFSAVEETDDVLTDQNHRSIKQFVSMLEQAAQEGWRVFDPATRFHRR